MKWKRLSWGWRGQDLLWLLWVTESAANQRRFPQELLSALPLPLVLPRVRTQLKKMSPFHTYLWDRWACRQRWGRGAPSCWSHWYCGANTRTCKLKKATKNLNSHTGEIFQSSVRMEQDTFKCISKPYSLILERCFPGRLGRWKGSDIKQCNFACNFALLSWRQRTFLLCQGFPLGTVVRVLLLDDHACLW